MRFNDRGRTRSDELLLRDRKNLRQRLRPLGSLRHRPEEQNNDAGFNTRRTFLVLFMSAPVSFAV
jgi:hypothetical protein